MEAGSQATGGSGLGEELQGPESGQKPGGAGSGLSVAARVVAGRRQRRILKGKVYVVFFFCMKTAQAVGERRKGVNRGNKVFFGEDGKLMLGVGQGCGEKW